MFETTIACAKTGCCGCLTGERVGQIFVFCCNECSTEAGRGTLAELAQAEARESAMRRVLDVFWRDRVKLNLPLDYQAMLPEVLSPDAGRALAAEVETLREALKAVERLRKRLPDPDFGEQQTTARAIGEVVRDALAP